MRIRDVRNRRVYHSLQEAYSCKNFSGDYEEFTGDKSKLIIVKPTQEMYETILHAAHFANISVYRLSQAIKLGHAIDGKTYHRRGSIFKKREVRCVDTGQIFPSAAAAAREMGALPVTFHRALMDGRRFKGLRFEYTGDFTPPNVIGNGPRDLIRDDAGNEFTSYTDLADAKGLTAQRARTLTVRDPDKIFRNAWLDTLHLSTINHDGKRWWFNGSIPADKYLTFKKYLGMFGYRMSYNEITDLMERSRKHPVLMGKDLFA